LAASLFSPKLTKTQLKDTKRASKC
jgi:hypothetical protein